MNRQRKIFKITLSGHRDFLFVLLILFSLPASSQITAYPVQDLVFGTFYQGSSGGTVEVSTSGSRTSTGDIILINTGVAPSQAIFEIEAPAGSIVSIVNGPDVTLNGSNGGTMSLRIGLTDPSSPINITTVPPDRTTVHVAGTLMVGDRIASPPGTYQGTFSINFHQE